MKRNYIGLACTGHDNALAVVNSRGEIVFAEATERFLQNKRSYNCIPDNPVLIGKIIKQYCEADAEIVIAKSWSEDAAEILEQERAKAGERLNLDYRPYSSGFIKYDIGAYQYVLKSVTDSIQSSGVNLKFYCEAVLGKKTEFRSFNHHLTHAATACYTSPYSTAACIVVDGMGEGISVSCYSYRDNKIEELKFPSQSMLGNLAKSLGFFYSHLCGWCGFDPWAGEEWKVMGLAPYGKFDQAIYEILRERIAVDNVDVYCPDPDWASASKLLKYIRTPDMPSLAAADLAHTGQVVFSEVMTSLLNNLYDLGISENLVFGGGCALNSSYNGKILESTKFKSVHVFSAPGDDGNAVGAALLAYEQDNPQPARNRSLASPYLGSTISRSSLENLVKYGGVTNLQHRPDDVCERVAQLLSQGKIVGWVQGRAEFGPRSLGNRSILADPRRSDMKNSINSRVKFREEFRPFAPSVLEEYGDEYFINYQDSPYMERTLKFREGVRGKVPAVVHVDGTGRLQSVKKKWNNRFYRLIEEFHRLTDVPMVLNTSLNVMGKPIIHSVEDALAVFYTSGLDVLVIEDYVIEKSY
ncbi:carbamoyltransferase family protein [Pseudomonas batumici]|uniref:BatF n=2 Tax=Pseudomonas TaxID=286 RepID=D4NZE1_PSEFL|nr:carbamoyltransferase C-terminal domain-containing protein [Pseudomonas batumici]ADD82947.1 BatF [Pseudomonas fluorescens]KIH86012.1 BatF, batumin synthesis operon, carbamoyl transferase [Pseudomonas batumici]